jgi:TPR repeat protein
MKLSAFCYSLHSKLDHVPVSRSHLFELVAAYFGYRTYAGFLADALPLVGEGLEPHDPTLNSMLFHQRASSLGYNSAHTLAILSEIGLSIKSANLIVASYRSASVGLRASIEGAIDDEEIEIEHWFSPPYHRALENLASQDDPKAHYIMALLYASDTDDGDFEDHPNPYWYQMRQQGRVLNGPEAEFADAYETWHLQREKFEAHLRRAAELGLPDALFELSRRFQEPGFFERQITIDNCTFDRREIAEIAAELGRDDAAHALLIAAAEQGDIDAMSDLVELYGEQDPVSAWKWFYVAEGLGTDLTQDHYVAIHEDGSLYDDDIGGNAFVAGYGGIELPHLDAPDKDAAKKMAIIALQKINKP